jgi:hypothetical protein
MIRRVALSNAQEQLLVLLSAQDSNVAVVQLVTTCLMARKRKTLTSQLLTTRMQQLGQTLEEGTSLIEQRPEMKGYADNE